MSFINKARSLPPQVLDVVHNKNTEHSYTGEYNEMNDIGTYLCRQCGLALFRSEAKFISSCGWPSFDNEIAGALSYEPDADSIRTEILCSRCKAHLGHVFRGEGFTPLNIRHCVNSISLDFVSSHIIEDTEEAIFAAGCFWGVEYYFKKLPGVLEVETGYIGGNTTNPSYEEVCQGNTGHFEAVRVLYDPKRLNFETIVKYFFQIHDPTQSDGQGSDLGQQYQSACFYYNQVQRNTIVAIITQLEHRGYNIATQVLSVKTFWRAEAYHQDYYKKTRQTPYCHKFTKRFDDSNNHL